MFPKKARNWKMYWGHFDQIRLNSQFDVMDHILAQTLCLNIKSVKHLSCSFAAFLSCNSFSLGPFWSSAAIWKYINLFFFFFWLMRKSTFFSFLSLSTFYILAILTVMFWKPAAWRNKLFPGLKKSTDRKTTLLHQDSQFGWKLSQHCLPSYRRLSMF